MDCGDRCELVYTVGINHKVSQMVKNLSACNAADPGSMPRLGRSPGEGNSNPPQYSCLENPMDRGAWPGLQRVRHD